MVEESSLLTLALITDPRLVALPWQGQKLVSGSHGQSAGFLQQLLIDRSHRGRQFLVAALLHNAAGIKHHDQIGVADRAKPVRHDDLGAAAALHGLIHFGLGAGIEG